MEALPDRQEAHGRHGQPHSLIEQFVEGKIDRLVPILEYAASPVEINRWNTVCQGIPDAAIEGLCQISHSLACLRTAQQTIEILFQNVVMQESLSLCRMIERDQKPQLVVQQPRMMRILIAQTD